MLIGFNAHVDWAEQKDPAVRAEIRQKMKSMGCTTVRIDYAWVSIQPTSADHFDFAELDKYINEFAEDGISVLVMLYWPPNWAAVNGAGGKNAVPAVPADFGRICGEVGKRYGSKLAGVEMWNEPDLDVFWAGTSQKFADLLAGAYPVAKGLAPNVTFLAAAPTYLGLASGWFAEMYSNATYQPGVSYDAQAIHPYPSPSDLPPNAPPSEWSITGIKELLIPFRDSHGDDSPLWATEFGWSTHDSPDNAENWKRGVTEAEQAAFYVGALILLDSYGVAAAHLYTDRDMSQTEEPHERNFGLLRTDNSEKPVVTILRAIHERVPEPPDPTPEPEPDPELEARVDVLEDSMTETILALSTAAEYLKLAAAALEIE